MNGFIYLFVYLCSFVYISTTNTYLVQESISTFDELLICTPIGILVCSVTFIISSDYLTLSAMSVTSSGETITKV